MEYEPHEFDEHDDTAEYLSYGILTPYYTKELAREARKDDYQYLLRDFHHEMETAAQMFVGGAMTRQTKSGETYCGGAVTSRHVGGPSHVGSCCYHNGVDLSCTKETATVVIPGPWKESVCFLMDTRDGTCFRVDTATDMLSQEELHTHEALVREADAREVKSFIDDKVFKLVRRDAVNIRTMNCIWVRM